MGAESAMPGPTIKGAKNSPAHDAPHWRAVHGGPQGDEVPEGQGECSDPETLVTRSKETHASSVHEDNTGEGEQEENPPLNGKRAASEDAEASLRPKRSKRPRRTFVRAAGKSPERVNLSDKSEDDPLLWGGRNRHLEGTPLLLYFVLSIV